MNYFRLIAIVTPTVLIVSTTLLSIAFGPDFYSFVAGILLGLASNLWTGFITAVVVDFDAMIRDTLAALEYAEQKGKDTRTPGDKWITLNGFIFAPLAALETNLKRARHLEAAKVVREYLDRQGTDAHLSFRARYNRELVYQSPRPAGEPYYDKNYVHKADFGDDMREALVPVRHLLSQLTMTRSVVLCGGFRLMWQTFRPRRKQING